ncbi:NAD(P)-binding protein [Wallemia mellicola]|uniref:NAD(P)-binding protein n=1 Tax=Wallemia mellicola TaxID=1708541 RepID=A0AB74K7S8_9BASI|nr:NAD(P)-binding protein [Wallemia mellicola]
MPAINTGKVLVTGASGFLAVTLVESLLDAGFEVRGTVRSSRKGEYLLHYFNNRRFNFIVVPDSVVDGAFDDAVQGMDGVIHTASPFHFNASHPDDLILPAVNGTLNLLKAAHEYGNNTLKRVVITSSIAAIFEPTTEEVVFTEESWNEFSIRQVNEKQDKATPADIYRASKSLAEKAAWEYVALAKTSFDIATVNPAVIFGPPKQQISSTDQLNTSTAMFYNFLIGKQQSLGAAGNFVDVRDVAKTHLLALMKEVAGGQRFLSNSDKGEQDVADVLHEKLPNDDIVKNRVLRGSPGTGVNVKQMGFSNKKAQELLGQSFTPFEVSVLDTFHSLCNLEKSLG